MWLRMSFFPVCLLVEEVESYETVHSLHKFIFDFAFLLHHVHLHLQVDEFSY